MSYDAVISARKDAEAKMSANILEGIRLGLQMRRERELNKSVKLIAANDNVPQDESGQSAGFAVGAERGRYIGLTRTKEPLYRNTEDRDGFSEDGIVPVSKYGMPSNGGPVFTLQRQGDWMQTFTGRQYWPCDPRADEVFIEDIAHSLSLQCRYAGHCIQHYSVAEHSVHVARWLLGKYGPFFALHGLLHDATEAYVVDVPRPLKPSLTNYKAIEAQNWIAIAARFGLARELPIEVHEADNRIIADELVNLKPMAWHARHTNGLGVKIGCWSAPEAEAEFLRTFEDLTRRAA